MAGGMPEPGTGYSPESLFSMTAPTSQPAAKSAPQRHGQPYSLHVTGPAGGRWSSGAGTPDLELDGVEFCLLVSGRGRGDGLLTVLVPF